MEGKLPSEAFPFIEGDFNACGWAGNGDQSIYLVNKPTLERISAKAGMLVFVWSDDEVGTIFGYTAALEHVSIGAFSGWRAKPVPGTFYRGPKPAKLSQSLVSN
jgi:hypothetical protein